MKIIFSRKGFDSSYGGVASPIFPDGRIFSLPVPAGPADGALTRFCDLICENGNIGDIVKDLTSGKLAPHCEAHLDPDLDEDVLERSSGWRPAFGQGQAAQTHLDNEGVGPGDLFLFFGWFRRVRKWRNIRCEYENGAPDLHVLFGWLQVDTVLRVGKDPTALKRYPWLARHPHLQPNASGWLNNTVYIAKETLSFSFDKTDRVVPGGGTFKRIDKSRILTDTSQSNRSVWKLPEWFYRAPLSRHGDPKRWQRNADGSTRLQTVPIGQEFVLDVDQYPEANSWLAQIFSV